MFKFGQATATLEVPSASEAFPCPGAPGEHLSGSMSSLGLLSFDSGESSMLPSGTLSGSS